MSKSRIGGFGGFEGFGVSLAAEGKLRGIVTGGIGVGSWWIAMSVWVFGVN